MEKKRKFSILLLILFGVLYLIDYFWPGKKNGNAAKIISWIIYVAFTLITAVWMGGYNLIVFLVSLVFMVLSFKNEKFAFGAFGIVIATIIYEGIFRLNVVSCLIKCPIIFLVIGLYLIGMKRRKSFIAQ